MIVVYKIESKKFSHRIYIGRTCNFKRRMQRHITELNCNRHHSIKLQRHFNKYGKEDLIYSIVEICNKENILDREQYYIDILNPYFNCYMSSFGKEQGSIPWNKGKKLEYSVWNKGKKMPEKQRLQMLGHIVTEKTRKKISKSKTGVKQNREVVLKRNRANFKPVLQYDINGDYIAEFESIKQASEISKIGHCSIGVCCRGIQKTAGGFVWRYKNI